MDDIRLAVCKAGYYRSESLCITCTGNTIKTTAGNAANCNVDDACDGMTTAPNENHTACGTSSLFSSNTCISVVCNKLFTINGINTKISFRM